jgi:hypothetical protein
MSKRFNIDGKLTITSAEAMTLPRLASDPVSGMVAGDMYYNTASNRIRYFDGTIWDAIATGDVSLVGQILNENEVLIGDPSDESAAVDTSIEGDILADSTNGLTIKAGAVADGEVASGANIQRSKLASGTANRVVVNDAGGVMSDAAAITAARALISDANGIPTHSTVTSTELGYSSGVTSAIQTQLNSKIPATEKGAALGVATLDAGGKVPVSQLPSAVMTYEGVWAADTNTPTLADGVGDAGMVYRVTGSGSVNFGSGSISFNAGDYVIYSGTIWQKSDGTDAVVSVNGYQGVVIIGTDDVAEGVTNLYFQVERAQNATGAMVANSSKVSLTYVDATPSLTADIIAGSLVNADINASAAIDATKIADGSVSNTEFQYLDGVTSGIQTQLGGKANLALSNLASTAVNVDILPGVTNSVDLGSASFRFAEAHAQDVRLEKSYHKSATSTILSLTEVVQAAVPSATASFIDAYSFALSTSKVGTLDYTVVEAVTGEYRSGQVQFAVKADGSSIGYNDTYTESGVIGNGIEFQVVFSSGNVLLQVRGTSANSATVVVTSKLIVGI